MCPLLSESVNYDSSKCCCILLTLPHKKHDYSSPTIRINMQYCMHPEKYCVFPLSLSLSLPSTKFECSKLHIQSIFVCVFNPVKHGSTL